MALAMAAETETAMDLWSPSAVGAVIVVVVMLSSFFASYFFLCLSLSLSVDRFVDRFYPNPVRSSSTIRLCDRTDFRPYLILFLRVADMCI